MRGKSYLVAVCEGGGMRGCCCEELAGEAGYGAPPNSDTPALSRAIWRNSRWVMSSWVLLGRGPCSGVCACTSARVYMCVHVCM